MASVKLSVAEAEFYGAALAELRELRPLLDAAHQLLGGDCSRMVDDDAETAHLLVRRCLHRIDEATSADAIAKPATKAVRR